MITAPKIFGKPRDQFLADLGYALLQVKRARGLSPEDMRIVFGLKCGDMVPKYIAGEHEMSMTTWLRAVEAWPEIIELLQETENERALKGRQRALDLEETEQRRKAA
jgi:hypothetical protein